MRWRYLKTVKKIKPGGKNHMSYTLNNRVSARHGAAHL